MKSNWVDSVISRVGMVISWENASTGDSILIISQKKRLQNDSRFVTVLKPDGDHVVRFLKCLIWFNRLSDDF